MGSRPEEVAAALLGTCRTLEEFASEDEINDLQFCRELDDLVFCCDECGWWCGTEEANDLGFVCDDCWTEIGD